ncbi:hypothetical protein DFH06DRAFT_207432 [Mycena polygramma]|nr:hypothetical protein DFH06DRAFT_207432 [Mycena polygramma]
MIDALRWKAAADAKTTELKAQGDAAHKNGDFKLAFVVYTACGMLSAANPDYSLSRAATAFKLKMYQVADDDGRIASKKADAVPLHGDLEVVDRANAYLLRGRGWFWQGYRAQARDDYNTALQLVRELSPQLKDQIIHELAVLVQWEEKLGTMRISECSGNVSLDDIFDPGELDRRTEELMAGTATIAECMKRAG